MGGNGEVGLVRSGPEIPQPGPGSAFEGGAITAEARALRRAGRDVGHGVEGSVGVFSEFLEVAGKAAFQIRIEFRLLVVLPWARLFRQLRPTGDQSHEFPGFDRGDSYRSDADEGFPPAAVLAAKPPTPTAP